MKQTERSATPAGNDLRYWRAAGTVTIIISGVLLHYLYAWSGDSGIIGLLAPVNESVWEHLKLGYWAVALFSLIEYPFVRRHVNNYFFAKAAGVLVLELTILVIFYGYMAISGKDLVWLDILSYVLGAFIGQWLAYQAIRMRPLPATLNRLGLAVFAAIGILFGAITYFPPHAGLFKDSKSGTYGIFREK